LREFVEICGSNADKFKTYLVLTKILGLSPSSYDIIEQVPAKATIGGV
jgi:hypothetical protein